MTTVSRCNTSRSFLPYTKMSSAKIRKVPIAGDSVFERAAESHVLLDLRPITDLLYVSLPVILGQPLSWPVMMRSSGAIIIQWYAPLTSSVAQLFWFANLVMMALGDMVVVAASSILWLSATKSQQCRSVIGACGSGCPAMKSSIFPPLLRCSSLVSNFGFFCTKTDWELYGECCLCMMSLSIKAAIKAVAAPSLAGATNLVFCITGVLSFSLILK